MKIFITVLLSALILWGIQQETPVNKSFAETKVKPVQVATPETVASKTLTEQEPVSEPATPDLEAEAKAFIYFKESSNNPAMQNSIGCYGLGQDCNGIVKDKCGADYACQDAYFTSYMLRRYGSWQAAKSFWINRVPINGRDVGNWW